MDLLEKISYKKSVQGLEDIDAEMAAIEERIRERRKKITLRDDLAIKYEEIIIEMGPEEPAPEIVTEEAINAGTRENKSRREFLKKTAKVGLGLAAGGVLVGVGNLLENEAKRKHKKQAEAPTHPTPVDTVKIETPPIDSVKAEKPAIDSTEIKRLEESR
ncbi:MAG: hypothetical protein KA052_02860, partial [Candidatus Pacebacteria bacterium]|nr:hypothetical protein [Candidatus Paceibacterota bacterium]